MEFLFGFLCVLTIVTVVGHGIWVLVAFVIRSLTGANRDTSPFTGPSEVQDIEAMARQLNRLVERGLVTDVTRSLLRTAMMQRRAQIEGWPQPQRPAAEPPAAAAAEPAREHAAEVVLEPFGPADVDGAWISAAAPIEKAPEDRLAEPSPAVALEPVALDAGSASAVFAAGAAGALEEPVLAEQPKAVEPPSKPVSVPLAPPMVAPQLPRRSFTELLGAFMEERNIRWGELVGGMLIVGSSIALVVSLRRQLQEIPFIQFFISGGVTAALFGVGLYTGHRWKLEATSQALLIISTLLVPLNFLAMAWVSGEAMLKGQVDLTYLVVAGIASLALFLFLVHAAARLMVVEGRSWITLGVMGSSGLLLLLSQFVGRDTTPWPVFWLGTLPIACHTTAIMGFLATLLPHPTLDERRIKGLFTVLGTVTFSTLAAIGVLVYRTGQAAAVLHPIAPLVPLMAFPIVAGGFVAMRRCGEGPSAGGLQATGSGIALTGLVAMLVAVGLAWPQPGILILVALLDFAAFTFVAFRYRLPGVHVLALASLALAYLTVFPWLWGDLPESDPAALSRAMREAIFGAQSGTALVGFFVLLAAASELLGRRWRDHGAWYAACAGGAAAFSLALVTFHGWRVGSDSALLRSATVYAIYGLGSLAVNARWRQPSVAYGGLALTVGATLWLLAWATHECTAAWGVTLAIESLVLAAAAWIILHRTSHDRGSLSDPASDAASLRRGFGLPLARSSEVVSWLAIGLGVWSGLRLAEDAWSAWHILTGVSLAAAYLTLLASRARAHHAWVAGSLVVGSAVAAAGWAGTTCQVQDLAIVVVFSLGTASAVLAAIATSVSQFCPGEPSDGRLASAEGRVWYAPLSRQWLDVAMGSIVLGLVLTGVSRDWASSPFGAVAAVMAGAACCMAAWGYRWPGLSWLGSAFLFAAIAQTFVGAYPRLLLQPWPFSLLLHGTVSLLAGGVLSRRYSVEHRRLDHAFALPPTSAPRSPGQTILAPVIESGIVTSGLAFAVLFVTLRRWDLVLPSALDVFWGAAVWLILAWLRSWRPAFAVAQAALTAGVLLATTAWLGQQSWVSEDVQQLFEPWSLQWYGIALGLLSLAWLVLRILVREHPAAHVLLGQDSLAVDRLVLLTVTFAHLALVAWGVVPGVARELNLGPAEVVASPGALALQVHACGFGAWALLCVLAACLVVALWNGWRTGEAVALCAVAATAATLLGGFLGGTPATATALRWTLAVGFLGISGAVWAREAMKAWAARLRARVVVPEGMTNSVTAFVTVTTAVPALALSLLAVAQALTWRGPANLAGSLFATIPSAVSFTLPLVFIAGACVGYALRERSAEFAFVGGLIAAGAVVGCYLLAAVPVELVRCLQLFAIASAVWAIGWLAVRQRLDMWRDSGVSLRGRTLMTVQLAMPAASNTAILLLALLIVGFFGEFPNRFPVGGWVWGSGSIYGWAALALSVAAWAVRSAENRWPLRPEVIGLVGLAVIGLFACSVSRSGDAWGYKTLMTGWAMYALSVVAATWSVSARQFAGREPPRALIRTAAIWVRVPAILAVVLGIKGAAVSFQDLSPWSAAAIAVASVSAAAMAVWQKREGWAFAAGLGVNLACSLVVVRQIPAHGAELLENLVQANLVASALVALAWLAARQRLYRGQELTISRGPLLSLQLVLILLTQTTLACVPVIRLFLEPASDLGSLVNLARPAGWLAWALAAAAVAWYAWQVARPFLVHSVFLFLLSAGSLLTCQFPTAWSACHTLLLGWCVVSVLAALAGELIDRWNGFARQLTLLPDGSRVRETCSRWAAGTAGMVVVFALRSGWWDADGPYWAASSIVVSALVMGAVSIGRSSVPLCFVSGLLFCAAGSIIWWHESDAHRVATLISTNGAALGVGAAIWAIVLLFRPDFRERLSGQGRLLVYPQAAAFVGMLLMAWNVVLAILGEFALASHARVSGWVPWAAVAATGLSLAACLRWPPGWPARGGIYGLCLTAANLVLHQLQLDEGTLRWCLGWVLPAYVLAAAAVDYWASASRAARRWWLLSERGRYDWFGVAQAIFGAAAIPLTVWIALDSVPLAGSWAALGLPLRVYRSVGALAVVMLVVAAILMAKRSRAKIRDAWQFSTFCLGAMALAEWACSVWPTPQSLWLERAAIAMAAMGVTTTVCGWLSATWLPEGSSWSLSSRRALRVMGILGFAALMLVLGLEAAAYDLETGTPMTLATIATVALTLAILAVICVVLALSPRPDPFGLSDRGRQAYVYGMELLILLLCVHLWCTVPELFRLGFVRRYWLFFSMAIAFAGTGLSQLFESRRLPVLAIPLQNTALALPLLPAIAYWLPLQSESSPWLWFLIAGFYGFEAYSRRSFWCAAVAVLVGNLGLWVTWYEAKVYFDTSPQLWLIPPALVVLIVEYLYHDRLGRQESATIRYLALSVVYVSSTADMFLSEIGTSLYLPLILAVLSVAGVLAGMMLRVRAFLLLGVAFLLVDILAMIWYAAVDLRQTWVWYVFGLVLGIVMIAVLGFFEKRRNDVLAAIEAWKKWH